MALASDFNVCRVCCRLSTIFCEVAPGAGRPATKAASNCCEISSARWMAWRTVFSHAASASPATSARVRPTALRTCGLSLSTSNGTSMPRRSAAARASGFTWAMSTSLALAAVDPGPMPPALRAKFNTSPTSPAGTAAAAPGAAGGTSGAIAVPIGAPAGPGAAGGASGIAAAAGAAAGATVGALSWSICRCRSLMLTSRRNLVSPSWRGSEARSCCLN